VQILTTPERVAIEAAALAKKERIAFDLESNGLFAYRARVCYVQLGCAGNAFAVDALATAIAPLAELLGAHGPVKIVHDVAFDARLLAEAGVELGNCHDTAIVARMLGRRETGLASLLLSELGIAIRKTMQKHDWSQRPLDAEAAEYLASDIAHLEALDDVLWGAASAVGICEEVLAETEYRILGAVRGAREPDTRPPWTRVKGTLGLDPVALAILRRLCDAREGEAKRLDVPPYKIVTNEVLVAIARARPNKSVELRRIAGATAGRAKGIAHEVLSAVERGTADGGVPEAERAWIDKPKVPTADLRARRVREAKLTAWRATEAKRRGVDEQAVLPGHCVKDVAADHPLDLDALLRIPGIGAFRVARDGEAMLRALGGKADDAAR
jgi:ribonuclease D